MFRIFMLLAVLSLPAHADTRVSQLPDGGASQAGDSVLATRSGQSVKVEVGTAASKAASDGTKPTVSSVSGAVTAGHVAVFNDASGTVADGGALSGSATSDTTNASNITSGTLSGARLPAPAPSILGGIRSLAAAAHQFLTGVDTSGNPTAAQPAASDISGLAAVATSGAYSDLSGKPAIPSALPPSGAAAGDLSGSYPAPSVARINGATPAAVATSGSYFDLLNLPTLGTAASHAAADFLTPTSTVAATGATVSRVLADHFADHYSVKDWGAKCDGTVLTDVTTSTSSPVISSASYAFAPSDVGKAVYLTSQSTENALLSGAATIVSVSGGNAALSLTPTGAKSSPNYARLTMYATDDTAAINAAINAVAPDCNPGVSACVKSAGSGTYGATLDFPAGVCPASQITVDRQVILRGQGRQNTILFQIGGANASFIASENFAALTGTGLNYGPAGTFNGVASDPRVPSWMGLVDLHVDGNRGYQTAGDCVDFYGNAQVWQRTFVEDCYRHGQWTEASSAFSYSSTDWRAQEEGFMDDMVVRNTGVDGWVMAGPHDSQVTSYVAYGWGYSGSGYGFDQKAVGGASGGAHFGTIHPYSSNGAKTDLYLGSGSSDFQLIYSDFGSTTIASGGNRINSIFLLSCGYDATGNPCLEISGAGNIINQIYGTWYFGTLPTGLTMVQLDSGGSATTIDAMYASSIVSSTSGNTGLSVASPFNNITASVDNMTGAGNNCVSAGGSYNTFNLTEFGCATFLNLISGEHNNKFNLSYYITAGQTAVNGTFAATDVVDKTDANGDDYLNVEAGSPAKPSVTFGGNATTGLFGSASDVDVSVGGSQVAKFYSGGLSAIGGTIKAGVPGTTGGQLVVNGATSGSVTVTAPAAAGTTTFQLPGSNGSGGYVLQTNGSGVTSWVSNVAGNSSGVTYLSGNWYTNQPRNSATGVFPTAGILVAAPLQIFATATFDRIGMETSAIGSGATAFLCVYDSAGANGGPGSLVTGGSTASTAFATTGDFSVALASPVSLAAGMYYVAAEFGWTTTAPTVYVLSSLAPEMKFMPQGTVYNATGGATVPNTGYYLTNAYASGCPSTYGTPTGKVQSASTPIIALHAQ